MLALERISRLNDVFDAESGTPHTTARRLGALYEDIAPIAPELFKAYGRRTSEVSACQAVIQSPRIHRVHSHHELALTLPLYGLPLHLVKQQSQSTS